jgi:hypothetical protein
MRKRYPVAGLSLRTVNLTIVIGGISVYVFAVAVTLASTFPVPGAGGGSLGGFVAGVVGVPLGNEVGAGDAESVGLGVVSIAVAAAAVLTRASGETARARAAAAARRAERVR